MAVSIVALTVALSVSTAAPQARVDRFGDPLPEGAVARLGSLRFRYEGYTQEGLVFSPDGKILAGLFRRGIYLWDARSGRELRRLNSDAPLMGIFNRPFDFSPDGANAAALDITGKIRIWDVGTGRLIRTLSAPKAAHYQGDVLRYSPDGKQIAICWHGDSVRVLDAESGKEVRQFRAERREITDFAFAPDGKTLALAASHPSVRLWDVATGKLVRSIEAPPKEKSEFANSIAFSRDSKWIAAGYWDRIVVTETATGKEVAQFEAKCEMVSGLVFTADGRTLLSSSQDGKLRIWDVTEKKLRFASDNRHRHGRCVALSPDGKTAAMGTGGPFVRLWDVASGKELFTEYSGPDSRITGVVFSPDGGTLLAPEESGRVHVWDTVSWREKSAFDGGREIDLTADGKQMAWVDSKNTIHIRDTGADKDRQQWSIPGKDRVFRPVFAGGVDRLVTAVYKPVEPTLATADRWGTTRLVVWSAETGKARHEIVLPQFGPLCMAVSSDGSMAYLGGTMPKPAIVVCDLERGAQAPSLQSRDPFISGLSLSPDGRLLASVSNFDQSLRLWETASGKQIRVWPKQASIMAALAFSPDGRILACADGSPPNLVYDVPETPRLHFWDVVSGQEIAHRQGHNAHIWALAFSPDGKRLATVQGDSTVLIWDVSSVVDAVPRKPIDLDAAALKEAWDDLANDDASKAMQAVWKLAAAPHQAATLLKEHLRPIKEIEARRVRQWIAELDSDDFKVREAAVQKLIAADRQVEPELRQTLAAKPSLEMRRRVEDLLQRMLNPPSAETLRVLRAIAVLEQINSAETRLLLRDLAQGAPAARQTRAANKALLRRGR